MAIPCEGRWGHFPHSSIMEMLISSNILLLFRSALSVSESGVFGRCPMFGSIIHFHSLSSWILLWQLLQREVEDTQIDRNTLHTSCIHPHRDPWSRHNNNNMMNEPDKSDGESDGEPKSRTDVSLESSPNRFHHQRRHML